MRRGKAADRKKSARAKKVTSGKRSTSRKKSARQKKTVQSRRSSSAATAFDIAVPPRQRGLGLGAGGQSGDIQGLSGAEDVDSESVEGLAEEGQDFEAEVVSGVENAPDPDQAEVHTKEVREDDVPPEYLDND